jgi:NAD(P) transhydrogenase subunit alpha
VASSVPDQTVVTENGVTVIGAGRLPSSMPAAASAMFSRNISSLLLYLVKDGELALDLSDDLQAGVVVTRDGSVVHPALATPAGGAADADGAAD